MAQSIKMPALGESVTEGTVSAWLKNVGDTVEADEPIVEVATDKVDSEVPSPPDVCRLRPSLMESVPMRTSRSPLRNMVLISDFVTSAQVPESAS